MASLNSILNIFTPKNKLFYDLFENMTDKVIEMSEQLKLLVAEKDYDKRAILTNSIENLEHVCDDISHNIFTELGRNFITPFDREDIHTLASSLDDIADHIHGSSKKMNFYNVAPDDGIRKMADLIDIGSKHVRNAIYCLRNMKDLKKITEALVRINDVENEADDVFDMSIENLFANEPDAKEVIKKREIYQIMEIATDKCEDAGNVIETIIVKYA
jgi:predicted phosphate transport protein (TIGR00153 family)